MPVLQIKYNKYINAAYVAHISSRLAMNIEHACVCVPLMVLVASILLVSMYLNISIGKLKKSNRFKTENVNFVAKWYECAPIDGNQ